MNGPQFRVNGGRLHGGLAELHGGSYHGQPRPFTLITRPSESDNSSLRLPFGLTVRPSDLQWELLRAVAAQGPLMPRIHATLAIRDGWTSQMTAPTSPDRLVGPAAAGFPRPVTSAGSPTAPARPQSPARTTPAKGARR